MEKQQKRPIFTLACFTALTVLRLLSLLVFSTTRPSLFEPFSAVIELTALVIIVVSLFIKKKNITLLIATGLFSLFFLTRLLRMNFAFSDKTGTGFYTSFVFFLSSFLVWSIVSLIILVDNIHIFDKLKSKKALLNTIFIFVFVIYCIVILIRINDIFSTEYFLDIENGLIEDFEDFWFECFESGRLYYSVLDRFVYIVYAIALIPFKKWIYPTSNKILYAINKNFKAEKKDS
jgi:hypothetical protein